MYRTMYTNKTSGFGLDESINIIQYCDVIANEGYIHN